jgi:hypothetical protein
MISISINNMSFALSSRFRNCQTLIQFSKRTHKLLAASWTEYPLASLPVEGQKHVSTTIAEFASLPAYSTFVIGRKFFVVQWQVIT